MLTHVKFVNLPVDDLERALAFYTDRIGLKLKWREKEPDGWDFVELGMDGAQTRIVLVRRTSDGPGEEPALHFIDTDLRQSVERWRQAGVEIVVEPHPAPWDENTVLCRLRDSEGNILLVETH